MSKSSEIRASTLTPAIPGFNPGSGRKLLTSQDPRRLPC
jgi:hypothetical protein